MKKTVVVSFLAGCLLMVSAQAFGSGISLLGKKVDGEAKVLLNGKSVGQAVVIEGKSYIPVRDITNGFGGKVDSVQGGVIKLSSGNEVLPTEPNVPNEPDTPETPKDHTVYTDKVETEADIKKKNELADARNKVEGKKLIIESTQKEVDSLTAQVEQAKVKADNDTSTVGAQRTEYSILKKVLEGSRANLDKLKSELAELEKQLAELEK